MHLIECREVGSVESREYCIFEQCRISRLWPTTSTRSTSSVHRRARWRRSVSACRGRPGEKRQASWLKRKAGDMTVAKADLRPRKRHRRATLQWVLSVHNQADALARSCVLTRSGGGARHLRSASGADPPQILRHIGRLLCERWCASPHQGHMPLLDESQVLQVHPAGLAYYQIAEDVRQRPPAASWPRISCAPDQGGDGLATYHALPRHMRVNIDITADPSHGANNDLWLFLARIGLRRLMLQWLISFNTPHGTWSEDQRYAQALVALSQLLATATPQKVPLFLDLVPDMIREKRENDIDLGPDPFEFLWNDLRLNHPWKLKGSQCVRSRFLGFTREAKKELQHFATRQFGYQHLCLEMGWLGEAQAKLVKVTETKSHEATSNTTSSKHETPEQKALRVSCRSSAVLACMTFACRSNANRLKLVVELTSPIEA